MCQNSKAGVSDREITETCSLLEKLEPGDSVMADKGFTIDDLLEQRGVTLNIPPFLSKKDQLSAAQVVETRRIAKLRIHVERQMERVKNYRILEFLPITLCDVTNKLFFCVFVAYSVPATPLSIDQLIYIYVSFSFFFGQVNVDRQRRKPIHLVSYIYLSQEKKKKTLTRALGFFFFFFFFFFLRPWSVS